MVTNRQVSPWVIAFIVSIATFMEVLDTTIVNVALTHIAGNLGASFEESTWVVTSYLVSNAIVLPLSGWLAGIIGRKFYFMASILCFTITSFLCGLADSLMMLVVFRFLQGISGGGLQPLQQAILLDAFPAEKRATGFAITGVTIVVAPVLGPLLGGYIADHYSWRWIFYINVPVGMIAFMLVKMFVEDPEHAKAKGYKGDLDMIGLGLVALGLGTLQIVLDKGQIEDWFESNFILFFSCICSICLVGAVYWLLQQKNPVIDLHLFKYKSYSIACFLMFVAGFILYSSIVILPFLLQSQFGYDAQTAGLVLSPASLVTLLVMAMTGKLSAKFQARFIVPVGFGLIATGMFYTMHYSPATDYQTFVTMRILQVVGLPLVFIPISTIAYMDIPKESYSKASALFSLARNIGGSVGIAVVTTVVARASNIWQNHLTKNLAPNDPQYQEHLTNTIEILIKLGVNPAEAPKMAYAKIYHELVRQATLMGYMECFYFCFIITLSVMPLLLLLPKNELSKKIVLEH